MPLRILHVGNAVAREGRDLSRLLLRECKDLDYGCFGIS